MTYNKKLLEITITTVDGNTVTITDTAEDQKASLALAQIKRGGNVLIEGDSSNTLVLASAIVQVEITQLEDAEVERANPYGCEAEGGNNDCNHPELGTLIYCGSASDKAIVILDGCDEGVQEGWCDTEAWHVIIDVSGGAQACATGVFDGNIVSAEMSSENSIRFGAYLEVTCETNPETGVRIICVSELQGASHYAIYTKLNPETHQCEE